MIKRCFFYLMMALLSICVLASCSKDKQEVLPDNDITTVLTEVPEELGNYDQFPEWLQEQITLLIQDFQSAVPYFDETNYSSYLPKVYICEWEGHLVYYIWNPYSSRSVNARYEDGTFIEFNGGINQFYHSSSNWKCIWKLSKIDFSLPPGIK